jgi:hypothetical protein
MEINMSNRKMVFGVLLCILGQVLIQIALVPVVLLSLPELLESLVMSVLYVCLTLLFVRWMTGKFLHRDLADFRITKLRPDILWAVELGAGVILPIFLYVMCVPGEWKVFSLSPLRMCITFVKAFGSIGLGAALAEELLFRGIVLRLVEVKLGTKWAFILPAVFWAFLHLLSADFSQGASSLVRVLSVTYVGVVFSVITVVTGSVWNSVFFHTMWNFITSGVIAIGDQANDHVMFNYVSAGGNIFLAGGENGIDGSVLTLGCYTLAMVLVLFLSRRNSR